MNEPRLGERADHFGIEIGNNVDILGVSIQLGAENTKQNSDFLSRDALLNLVHVLN